MALIRRRTKGSPIITGIVLMIVGLIFIIPGLLELKGIKGDKLNLNEAEWDDFKDGEYCEITLVYDYGAYCENVQTTNYVFKRTTDRYYLVDAGADDAYYMGIKIAESSSDELENLSYADETNTNTITYTGKLHSSSSELQGYLDDYIYDMYVYWYGSISSSDRTYLEDITLPYYMEIITPSSCSSSIIVGSIAFAIGILLVILGVYLKKKQRIAASSTPVTPTANTNYGAGYDSNTFGSYSGTDTSAGYGANNPYQPNMNQSDPNNPYGNPAGTPYSPGALNGNQQAAPYVDPFAQTENTGTANDASINSDKFKLKD